MNLCSGIALSVRGSDGGGIVVVEVVEAKTKSCKDIPDRTSNLLRFSIGVMV